MLEMLIREALIFASCVLVAGVITLAIHPDARH